MLLRLRQGAEGQELRLRNLCDKLVQKGIVLGTDNYNGKAQFLFTGLNAIKPDMIQEANRNARKAAEQFAADANSPVGAIHHAVQGPSRGQRCGLQFSTDRKNRAGG